MEMITINGELGGGSVLRVGVPIALGTNKTIRVTNIRSMRKKPGLRNQHMIGLELLAKLHGATIDGLEIGSQSVTIHPPTRTPVTHPELRINTAASVSLILQIAINYVLATRRDIAFTIDGGGTYTEWAPNIDYCRYVQTPIFERIGLQIDIDVRRDGFYPKGGAIVDFSIKYKEKKQFNFEYSAADAINVYSVASNNLKNARVAERQIDGFRSILEKEFNDNIRYTSSIGTGTAITAVITDGNGLPRATSQNGKRGLRAEKVGSIAADALNNLINHQVSVDDYMADQLIVPMFFSRGSSYTFKHMTDHVKTNMDVIKSIADFEFKIEEMDDYFRITSVECHN